MRDCDLLHDNGGPGAPPVYSAALGASVLKREERMLPEKERGSERR
ncbi:MULTISPECIES: hypothetical protein [unclassified Methanoculleus]|jgi:hypothetical protein|uniref:Uncharacterized protein n=1 Tax=Methanoculleus palmolei TaxID=72612 RepID=A0ABD8A738_9EURY|nr:hypothetical protein [Methanoculleus sp. UBA377]MDD2473793.1 hypothetical protein [Methanoculleus sp.]WOX54827.1 hypothetical protein R6Y95_04965 [Methanoculleus palmolei]